MSTEIAEPRLSPSASRVSNCFLYVNHRRWWLKWSDARCFAEAVATYSGHKQHVQGVRNPEDGRWYWQVVYTSKRAVRS